MRSIGCWVLLGVASVCSLSVSAQTGCEETLTQAQGLYVSGAFSEVEATLEPCLQRGQLGEGDRVLAHRLLILSALQQGRLIEAKLVALALLNLRPDYEPDPAFDPPSYADLIHTVRSQLVVSQPEERADVDTLRVQPHSVQPDPIPNLVDRPPGPIRIEGRPGQVYLTSPALPFIPVDVEPPARSRRPGNVELGYWSGVVSFTGDFYRNDALDDYLTSDGPRLGLQSAYVPASWVAIGLTVEGSYHPKFPAQRPIVGQQAGVRTEAIVASVTVEARLRAWSRSRVSPYLSTGISAVAANMLDEVRYGGGPSVGLGVDVAVSEGLSLFTEATALFPLPEDAIDNSPRRHGDVFSGFRLGLRSRIGR